ncbi:DUF6011 domain-containing protein [Nonomuraea rosea]|uniref:DUF6011 domain-containing protein n=1 Tax=Nonomuraea rosea TaxID=638574 RepID=UPI003CD09A23
MARCVCKRTLTDPVSVACGIGPGCRRKLGITSRARVRLSGVWPGGDCPGRGDLLEDT